METALLEASHGLPTARGYQWGAHELGLVAEKVGLYGWTETSLAEEARKRYAA
jgi:hypothetical protein